MEDKEKYVIHIAALKQALNHGLVLKKVHRVIEFRQEAWLKPYIDMNTKLRTEAKNDFEKDFFKLMNNSVFGKTMENVRNHRDIKLVTSENRRNKLVLEPNYHTTKHFSEDLQAIEMRKTKVIMNKPVYLGQAILDISKTLLCMNFDMIILNQSIKKKQGYVTRILIALLLILKLRIFMKILLKIIIEFCALRATTYAFLLDEDTEKKKAKGTKKCTIKREIMFEHYKDCLFIYKTIIKSQLRFKSDHHDTYTEEV